MPIAALNANSRIWKAKTAERLKSEAQRNWSKRMGLLIAVFFWVSF